MATWRPLHVALSDVRSSVTYSWSELEALVGELPRSAYEHQAFWSGDRSGWPGFRATDVTVGKSVTFARSTTPRPPESLPREPRAARRGTEQPTVILVTCVKEKLDHPAPARNLYTSDLFRREREYAERSGLPWFILSAKHALVLPTDYLAPYDLFLGATTSEYRAAWGAFVAQQLARQIQLDEAVVEVHASADYIQHLRGPLREFGAAVIEPLAGLSFGKRLQWYAEQTVETVPTSRRLDVNDTISLLVDGALATTPDVFLTLGAQMRHPGLYSWWVDDEGASDLSLGLGHSVKSGLIYAGLAGATRAGGKRSSNTLWGRITTMHLGGRHEFSTFRLSLGSILANAMDEHEIDEAALTQWMYRHLRVRALPVDDADSLGALESEVLQVLNPPLNLDKVERTDLRRALSALRKHYGRRTKSRSNRSES